ncbi:MAG: hypothetical protein EA393_00095 [Bacteroidetes bacterium]|nr:MAG: hypothetical protein EA393_00095 [Bacteroidota bacterium]
MKKILLIILGSMMIPMAYGNEKDHAIGLRVGIPSKAASAEISYQYNLTTASRLEFGLGVAEYPVQAVLMYQRVGDLSSLASGLKVYAGAGVVAGFYSSKTGVGIAAQGGLEYNFKSPFQVSLDYRPKVFWPGQTIYYDDISVGVRYKF